MHSGYIIIFHHIQVCGICTIYKIVLLTYLLTWSLMGTHCRCFMLLIGSFLVTSFCYYL